MNEEEFKLVADGLSAHFMVIGPNDDGSLKQAFIFIKLNFDTMSHDIATNMDGEKLSDVLQGLSHSIRRDKDA